MNVKRLNHGSFSGASLQLWISRAGILFGALAILYALYAADMLLLLVAAAFVYSAFQFHLLQQSRITADGQTAALIMVPREKLDLFSAGTSLSAALSIAARSLQRCFPVLYCDELVGIVDRDALLKASVDDEQQYVPGLMVRDFLRVEPQTRVADILEKTGINSPTPVAVISDSRFQGLIFPERIPESLLFQTVKSLREGSIPTQEHI